MNKSDVAYLVSESYSQNDYGVIEKTTQKRKIFCNVTSVNSQEWFEGGRNGLNPQYRFTVYSFEYLGESVVEYRGVFYSIYRTFILGVDEIELYAEKRQGNLTNG